MNTEEPNTLNYPFGHSDEGKRFVFRPQRHGHALLVGGTGKGKSVSSGSVAAAFLNQGADVNVLSPKSDEITFYSPEIAEYTPNTDEEKLDILAETHQEMQHRYTLLSEGVDATQFTPRVLVIDSIENLPAETNSHDQGAFFRYSQILRMGRTVSVHLVVTSQDPRAAIEDGVFRDNFGFRAQYGDLPSTELQTLLWGPQISPTLCLSEKQKNGNPGTPVYLWAGTSHV